MNGRQGLQPVVHVAVQEEPRLGRDVVGEEQLLAAQREREGGATDPARQLDPAGPVVVVRRRWRASDAGMSTSGRRVLTRTHGDSAIRRSVVSVKSLGSPRLAASAVQREGSRSRCAAR